MTSLLRALGIIVFSLLMSVTPHVKASELTSAVLEPLRECLSGWLSQSERTHPQRDTRFHGNLFLLEQQPSSIACPSPRKDVIAWASPTGPDAMEYSFLFPNEEGKTIAKRFVFKNAQTRADRFLEIPGSEHNCIGDISSLPLVSSAPAKQTLKVRLESWPANFPTDHESQWKLGRPVRLASIESISPTENEQPYPDDQFKPVLDPPAVGSELAEQLINQLAHHWIRVSDRFHEAPTGPSIIRSQSSASLLPKIINQCEKAIESLAPLVGQSDRAQQTLERARGALATAASVFDRPRPGYPTIRNLSNGQDVSPRGSR